MRKVLALDGGGIRGIMAVVILRELEIILGKPLHKIFDLIIGTSTGAIIAAGIGAGMPMSQMYEVYLKEAINIFKRSFGHRWFKTGNQLWGPKYPLEPLLEVLTRYLGDTPLSASKTNIITTAYDIEIGSPYFFKSYKAASGEQEDYTLVQAAAGSGAAPTYFPPLHIPCKTDDCFFDKSLIDGGLYAGNPAMCGITEAMKLWPEEEFMVVSIGTGGKFDTFRHKKVAGWGLLKWAGAIIGMIFDAQADTADYHIRHWIEPDKYFRWQPILPHHISMDTTKQEELEFMSKQALILIGHNKDYFQRMCDKLK